MKFLRRAAISSLLISTLSVRFWNVEVDDVAFANCSDGSTDKCFGSDVAGGEAACGAGEAAIGEESNGVD